MSRSLLTKWVAMLLALAAFWPVASPAAIIDPKVVLEKNRQTVEEAFGRMSVMREAAAPLIDYAANPLPDPGCTVRAPRTYAVLVGVNTVLADPRTTLKGAENDVDLVAAAFRARFHDDVEMVELKGDAASRDSLRTALLDVLRKVQCGDLVAFYFGGQATFFAFDIDVDLARAAKAIPRGDPSYDHAQTVLNVLASRAMFFLAGHEESTAHPFSAIDLGEFVSNVRNRRADIMVVLDAPHSGAAALLTQQQQADPATGWSATPDSQAFGGTQLVPDHGDFAAFYSSTDNKTAIEKRFTMPDGSVVIHGNFSFAFASAVATSDAVTARSLADQLQAAAARDASKRSPFNAEGSNPNMVLFERQPSLQRLADAIVITSPEPMRGPSAVKTAAVEIVGHINWITPVSAVLVNGTPAEIAADGTFSQKVVLTTGLNAIKVIALTPDNQLLQRSVDVVYAGDVDALKGNGRNYAVIIANAAYAPETGFNALDTPVADGDAIAAELTQKFGFVTSATLPNGTAVSLDLRNASGRDIAMALYNVGQVAGADDTVVIYYAGHGIYEPLTTTAFWVPIDAVAGLPPTYLSASTISEAIARIQARKVMLISDSCFSGALMRGSPEGGEDIDQTARVNSLLALSRGKTRLLISSGNNEPVSDAGGKGHSVFAQALLNGLENEQYDEFTARELFDGYVITAVTANSKQEPQFRPLENVGHEGGDVIFVRTKG